MAVPKRSFVGSTGFPIFFETISSVAYTIPSPIGNIMAVVAVLLIHMERKPHITPKASNILAVLFLIIDIDMMA